MHTNELLYLIEHPEESCRYRTQIEATVRQYPWFSFAGELLLQCYSPLPDEDENKRRLKRNAVLRSLSCNYRPLTHAGTNGNTGASLTQETIDRFMAAPPKRVPLPPPAPEERDAVNEDLAAETNRTPEAASETLAGIYERQGIYDKAIDIYRKLSLKYPEKSIYFANRIERLETLQADGTE